MTKRFILKMAAFVGLLALCWILDINGIRTQTSPTQQSPSQAENIAPERPTATIPAEVPLADVPQVDAPQAEVPAETKKIVEVASPAKEDDVIVRDGAYYSKEDVARYIGKFNGRLPKNFITKSQARALGWQGGPLEPYAPGKAIGGDRFGNYEGRLPDGTYKECDIDTLKKPRGAKRLIFTTDGKTIYYTPDHYETFERIEN